MKTLTRKPAVIILSIIAAVILWAAFRPELLFVNKSVNDPFPVTTTTSASHL